MSNTSFRQPVIADAERCYAIEIGAYEGDEAATLEKIRTRISQYPEGFLLLQDPTASSASSTVAAPTRW